MKEKIYTITLTMREATLILVALGTVAANADEVGDEDTANRCDDLAAKIRYQFFVSDQEDEERK